MTHSVRENAAFSKRRRSDFWSSRRQGRKEWWLPGRLDYTNHLIGRQSACMTSPQVRRLTSSMRSRPFATQRAPETRAPGWTKAVRLQLLVYAFGVATSVFGQVPSSGAPSEQVEDPLVRRGGVTIYDGQQLSYEIIDGMAIHNGDMVLGTAEEVAAADREWRSRKHETPFGLERRDLSAEGGDLLWPGGIVPYVISEGFEPEAVQDIKTAIHEWNSRTVIALVERTTESDYVRFLPRASAQSGTTCSANVGRRDGERFVWLGRPSGCGVAGTVHEIGHSIGLRHEHQRFDRDEYVFVSDMVRFGRSGFSYTANRPVGGSYDYASIMHYTSVETIPPGMPVRSALWLSSGDIDGVARLYGMPSAATTISTNPPGLEIRVDGERVVTPASFDWEPGSKHVLQVPSAQSSGTERYVFGRWNDEGGFRRVITADPGVTWYEANFIVQRQLRACAVPPEAGQVTVRPESSGGFYSLRAPVQIEATADSDGGLEFLTWETSNGTVRNGNSRNPVPGLGVSSTRSWTAYEANFAAGPLFRIESNLSGFRINADRRIQYLPWAVPAAAYARGIVVEAPEVVPISSGVRYRFNSWSDGGPRAHRARVPPDGGSLRANLTPEYGFYLRALAPGMPPVQVSPQPSRGYFEGGTQVVLTATPREGVHFAGWVGDVSGTELVQTVQMDSVKNIWAIFTPSEPLRADEPVEIGLPASDQFDLHNFSDGHHLLVPPDAVELTVSFHSTTPRGRGRPVHDRWRRGLRRARARRCDATHPCRTQVDLARCQREHHDQPEFNSAPAGEPVFHCLGSPAVANGDSGNAVREDPEKRNHRSEPAGPRSDFDLGSRPGIADDPADARNNGFHPLQDRIEPSVDHRFPPRMGPDRTWDYRDHGHSEYCRPRCRNSSGQADSCPCQRRGHTQRGRTGWR